MAKNSMGIKTKTKILDSADDLFNAKGYEKVSVEEIAENAGITKAMVYYHFEGKETIMLELVRRLLEKIQLKIKEDKLDLSHAEALSHHMGEMIALWKANKEIGLFILTKGIKEEKIFSYLMEILKPFWGQFVEGEKLSEEEYREGTLRLIFYNALPMISFSVLSETVVKEMKWSEKKVEEIFKAGFMDNLKLTLPI